MSNSHLPFPTLTTERLVLRAFIPQDAADVRRLAGAREVAATTLNIPHPYPEGAAEEWIRTHQSAFEAGTGVNLAMTIREAGDLVGAIGLNLAAESNQAELGYWVGVPYWNRGYCSEAAAAVLAYGFGDLGVRRIHAHHLGSNPASGRVMIKIGMTYEGTLRQHVKKWDRYEDAVLYGCLRGEFEARSKRTRAAP